MKDMIRESAARHPDAPAVETTCQTISYAELDRIVDDAARRLRALSCSAVGICLDDAPGNAHSRAGLPAGQGSRRVPSARACPIGAVDAHASLAGARVVVTRRAGCQGALAPEALERTPVPVAAEGSPNASDVVVFTSGSTGHAKAAVLGVQGLYLNALGANDNMPLGAGDRWLLSLPLNHVGGIGAALRTLIAGAALVIPNRSWSLQEAVDGFAATHVSVVATQLIRLLRAGPESAPASIRAVLAGGGPFSASLLREARARGYPVRTTYGLTEMGLAGDDAASGRPARKAGCSRESASSPRAEDYAGGRNTRAPAPFSSRATPREMR